VVETEKRMAVEVHGIFVPGEANNKNTKKIGFYF
jgi:hypothetical protein